MKSFDDLIHKQFCMSEEPTFRKEMDKAYDHYEPNIIKMIDRERGIYIAMEQDFRISHEWTETKVDFDADHLAYVEDVLSKPATRILDQSTGDIPAKKLDTWITKIKKALLMTQLNDFYKGFPNYLKSLELTLEKLEEIKTHLSLKKKKRGNPNNPKSLSISDEAKIIIYANKLLGKDPREYKPKQGAFVSERLKDDVAEDLKKEIPNISRYKVSRLLLKHYAETKA